MPRRKMTGSWLSTSVPPTKICPALGSISRLIIRIVVVLPQPDGPTRTAISPSLMSRLRSFTAAPDDEGKCLETPRSEIMTVTASPPAPGPPAARLGAAIVVSRAKADHPGTHQGVYGSWTCGD